MTTPGAVLSSFLGSAGAYVHVPFCRSICPFCPYNRVLYQPALVERYFAALRQEADRYVADLRTPFDSLYIGGGTPTLCLDELAPIVAALPVAGERAMETLPTHATPERLDKMQAMGITYVSLGIQSFDDGMLRHLRRPTTPEDNRRALENVAGRFACVDADLIFDVSFADPELFLSDFETCLEAGVDQVSTYPLMRFGYTPFGKGRHDRQTEHAVLARAEEIAARHGYERRSVWTFNRRTAPNYTSITRSFYLGMGAGAASYTGRRFLVNHFSLERYIAKIDAGELPIARDIALPPAVASAYAAFWQAYTGEIDVDKLAACFGHLPAIWWRTVFQILEACHWFQREDGVYLMTPSGRDHYHDLERWVTYHFIEPLWTEMMAEHEPDARTGTLPPVG